MTIRFADEPEIAKWDRHVAANPDGGNFLQGVQFVQQKSADGWLPCHVVIDDLAITVVEKHVFGLGRIWYMPKGPGVQSVEKLAEIIGPLRDFARSNGVFTIKIEPELLKTPENTSALAKLPLVSVPPIQPNFSTITVDIGGNLETVLKEMPQKGRYAINRAIRDGVTVEQVKSSDENCKTMYDLLVTTAEDAKFGVRNYEYYKGFWQRFESAGQGQMFFAMYKDKIVACAYAIIYGAKSTYKDGASIRDREAYGASHLLQWRVIEWAKDHGSVVHDLCGAPTPDQIDDKDHPHYGIGLFKRSFNPVVTQYVGCYEIPVRPIQHLIWRRVGERLVKRLHYSKHHTSYY